MRKGSWRRKRKDGGGKKSGDRERRRWRRLLLLLLLFENDRIRSSTRSITTARNDGNSAYCPPRGTVVSCRARRNYARRPSRDGDNSLFRLRSLIERPPSLSPFPVSSAPPSRTTPSGLPTSPATIRSYMRGIIYGVR